MLVFSKHGFLNTEASLRAFEEKRMRERIRESEEEGILKDFWDAAVTHMDKIYLLNSEKEMARLRLARQSCLERLHGIEHGGWRKWFQIIFYYGLIIEEHWLCVDINREIQKQFDYFRRYDLQKAFDSTPPYLVSIHVAVFGATPLWPRKDREDV